MIVYPNSKNRPFHLGLYPLETLPRDESVVASESARPPKGLNGAAANRGALTDVVDKYRELYAQFADGDPAPERAPITRFTHGFVTSS